jgi:hypothetical protein
MLGIASYFVKWIVYVESFCFVEYQDNPKTIPEMAANIKPAREIARSEGRGYPGRAEPTTHPHTLAIIVS